MTPGLAEIVRGDASVKRLASGFRFTEGPVWHPTRRDLLFSDIPSDSRWRWTERTGAVLETSPTHKCNGMTYDADLSLVVCEHTTNAVVRLRDDGTREVLASEFSGQQLNSPNDVVVASDGTIYFTDPTYGRGAEFGTERAPQLPFRGVYRISASGELELLLQDFDQPNGLCLSPDESRLYVNDSPRAHIRVFDRRDDGTLGTRSVFAADIGAGVFEEGIVDGMKCDELGNVWVTGPGGVWVFTPEGERLGVVAIPEIVGNMHWGHDDWHSMYVCASTGLYRFRTLVAGRREPFMTVTQGPELSVGASSGSGSRE